MLVSLIIPTLNEHDAFKFLLRELEAVLGQLKQNYDFELIIVDDGSTDGTREFVEKEARFAYPMKLIKRDTRGLASAVSEGFRVSRGEIIGVIDADLSHPPQVIPRLLEVLNDADLVIGSRHCPGGGVEEWPIQRRLFSALATALARPLSRGVKDPLSGFFFLKKSVIEGRVFRPIGYKILLEILVHGGAQNIKETPYVFRNRSVGKSKLNWRVAFDYLHQLIILYAFRVRSGWKSDKEKRKKCQKVDKIV